MSNKNKAVAECHLHPLTAGFDVGEPFNSQINTRRREAIERHIRERAQSLGWRVSHFSFDYVPPVRSIVAKVFVDDVEDSGQFRALFVGIAGYVFASARIKLAQPRQW